MKKAFWVVALIAFTCIAYILIAVTMPFWVDITTSVNASIYASSNVSELPGAVEAVQYAPLWIYFIPGVVFFAALVGILKSNL
jgi:hypothetical protein